jgi:hypothetical protein
VAQAKAPAWYWDPSARHQWRYFDGAHWTEHVADNGVAATDPTGLDVVAKRRRRRLAILAMLVVPFAVLAIAVIVANTIEGARGVDPHDRLVTIRGHLADAGILCYDWSVSTPSGGFGPATTADGRCTLAGGDIIRIETFRENRDKDRPPCPRLEGNAYWVDISGLKSQSVVPRLAAALQASTVTSCTPEPGARGSGG